MDVRGRDECPPLSIHKDTQTLRTMGVPHPAKLSKTKEGKEKEHGSVTDEK